MKKFKIFNKNKESKYDYIVAKESPMSFATETLQKTIINLEYVNVDKSYKVIQFTSALSSEGKTTIISNLAYLLGRDKKVLIIDLDLRKSKIHRVFDVANEKGLTEYLLDKISLEEAIRHDKELNVDYLISGEKTTAVINVLTAEKLKTLIAKLKEVYDYILVDSPPVLPVADSLSIAKLVDGIIFVVADNVANKKRIVEAFKAIEFTGTEIIGSIMTQRKIKRGSKYSYYYYYYE